MSASELNAPGTHANLRPRDAATLIVLDRSAGEPKVLLGRRHAGHVFMPGRLVFPGGRVDRDDHRVKVAAPLAPATERRLAAVAGTAGRARALAVAAVRELYEETGLCIGAFADAPPHQLDHSVPFARIGLRPDLSTLRIIARALTPPGRIRRYDTYFFAADAGAISHRIDNAVGADTELVELIWLTLADARNADLPVITRMVLDDVAAQIAGGAGPDAPAPYYHFTRGARRRELF